MTKISGGIYFKTPISSYIYPGDEKDTWIAELIPVQSTDTGIKIQSKRISSTMPCEFYQNNLIRIVNQGFNYIIRLVNCTERIKSDSKNEIIKCELTEFAPMQIVLASYLDQIKNKLEADPDIQIYSKDLDFISDAKMKMDENANYEIELLIELEDILRRITKEI